MGAGTYTGIEAVSNSIPVLREPKVETAKRTMLYMSLSLAFMVLGLMLSYVLFKVHFPVFIMNHVAILPKDKWPKGIFVNYWVTGKGNKISKSKGGAEPVPKMIEKYSVDGMRLYYSHVGSPYTDVIWDDLIVMAVGCIAGGFWESMFMGGQCDVWMPDPDKKGDCDC